MSCDGNRARLFGALSPLVAPLVGSEAGGRELLDTLFEVAANQAPPKGRAAQMAAAAAYQKLKARAAREGIELYPHQSASGLPAPEAVAAWAQVGALLDAVAKGKALAPLAADIQQSLAFRELTRDPVTTWNPALCYATRMALRRIYAENPVMLDSALRVAPQIPPACDTPLAALSMTVVADPQAPPAMVVAARHFLALVDAEALDDGARGAWGQVLARAAGLGIGQTPPEGVGSCPRCGATMGASRCGCTEALAAASRVVVVAAARVLADPDDERGMLPILSDPRRLGYLLLQPSLRAKPASAASPADQALFRAMRSLDRQRIARLLAAPGFPATLDDTDARWLYEATLVQPIILLGRTHVWEDGYLYPQPVFYLNADWDAEARGQRVMADTAQAVCRIALPDMLRMLAGGQAEAAAIQFTDLGRLELFPTYWTDIDRLREGDIMKLPCGCAFQCGEPSGHHIPIALLRTARGCDPAKHTATRTLRVGRAEIVSPTPHSRPLPHWQ